MVLDQELSLYTCGTLSLSGPGLCGESGVAAHLREQLRNELAGGIRVLTQDAPIRIFGTSHHWHECTLHPRDRNRASASGTRISESITI
jgi:hypothetical protein